MVRIGASDRRLILFTWAAVVAVMLAGVDREMAAILWGAQHDEKLQLWPARAAYLGQSVWDFQPPGTVFGWLGPKLSLVGFWIFGLGNAGLRILYLASSAVGLLCFGLACVRVAPGALGFLVFFAMAVNVTTIAVGRTALLENVAVASLAVQLWLWTCHRRVYVAHASHVGVACGALVLVKPNFVVYAYVLHACLLAVSGVPVRGVARHAVVCAFALGAWVVIHLGLLGLDGVLPAYIHNLTLSVRDHLGAHGASTSELLFQVEPYGLVTTAYQMGFWFVAWMAGWDRNAPVEQHPVFEGFCVAVPMLLLAGCVARIARRRPFARVPDEVWALAAFLVVNWIVAAQLFFALKRAYPFFGVVLLLAAMLLRLVWDLGRVPRVAIAMALLALHAVRLDRTFDFLRANGAELYTRNVEESSRTIDALVPEDGLLYAHGLSARFVWMARRRIVSWDDQLMNNQMIFDEAVARHASHVLLTDPRTSTADYVGGFRAPPGVRFDLVHTFVTARADTDRPMRSFLVALHEDPALEADPSDAAEP